MNLRQRNQHDHEVESVSSFTFDKIKEMITTGQFLHPLPFPSWQDFYFPKKFPPFERFTGFFTIICGDCSFSRSYQFLLVFLRACRWIWSPERTGLCCYFLRTLRLRYFLVQSTEKGLSFWPVLV